MEGRGHFLGEQFIASFSLSFQNVSLNMQMSHYQTHAIDYWWLFLVEETKRQVSSHDFISEQMKTAVRTFLVGHSLLYTTCWQIYMYYRQEVKIMGLIPISTSWFLKLFLSKQNYCAIITLTPSVAPPRPLCWHWSCFSVTGNWTGIS